MGENVMKKILNSIYSILFSIGKARAAAEFARKGDIAAAKALMMGS
jgi:hypothetical protein